MKKNIKIRGFNKASEAGVDIFAPSIFLGGCNLRCPYCINFKLALNEITNEIDIEEVRKYVADDKSEWLMISGGEPTINDADDLSNLLGEIKFWGCKVGMSTNGCFPNTLSKIIKLLNYVALDIKSNKQEHYDLISENSKFCAFNNMIISHGLLAEEKNKRKDFDYELRTTLFPPFIDKNAIEELATIIRKQDKWVLQQFRHNNNMIDNKCRNISSYGDKKIEEMISIAKKNCDNVVLRYV